MTNSLLASLAADRLVWLPELGVGYYPVTAAPYDGAYWEKYRAMDATPMGAALTAARVALVNTFVAPDAVVVDVGIGGGAFVEALPAFGCDVNPAAVDWLRARSAWLDPWTHPVAALTFWDSLEHIHEPGALLANAREWVFVSCPIFTDLAHVRRSKHFRPEEHCWYFTSPGLVDFMAVHGFGLVAANRMESELGREDIGTFVFRRTGPAAP